MPIIGRMAALAPQIDTTIQIVTPENIAFDYQVAGPFRRWPAYLLDLAARFGLLLVIVVAANLLDWLGAGALAVAAILLVWFLLEWFYGGFFESYWNGQTPGKWLLGIRVLTIHGQPINALQAVMRNVLRAVDMYPLISLQVFGNLPPVYLFPTFFLGLVVMSCNRRFQRLGDLVCGTMVVSEERPWWTGVAQWDDPRVAQLADLLPADLAVSPELARTLAAYVERRPVLHAARRREIARHLGAPLTQQLGLPADTSDDLLVCALYHRAFIGGSNGDGLGRSGS